MSDEYALLPQSVRDDIDVWRGICQRIVNATSRGESKTLAVARESSRSRFGQSTIRLKLKLYLQFGFSGLIDKRKMRKTEEETHLPAEFIEHWRTLCEENKRASLPAHRALIRAWAKGEPIPGYFLRPEADPNTGIPYGWSYANLSRHSLTALERTMARRGARAANDFKPMVLSTREGLRPGERYMFDDRWNDFKVSFQGRHGKPLELGWLDLCSGFKKAGIKPPLMNGDKRVGLRSCDMNYLIADLLCNVGVHKDGTTLMLEHGTAAINSELEAILKQFSPVPIRFERGGLNVQKLIGDYASPGRGNFRFKAPIESSHNLVHNELANLPGQVGSNSRTNAMESHYGRTQEAEALEQACLILPPEICEMLNKPFLDFYAFCRMYYFVIDRINKRTDHQLSDWSKCGFVREMFRLNIHDTWKPISELMLISDPIERRSTQSFVTSKRELHAVHQLSPHDVWMMGQKDLVRFPLSSVPHILGESSARTETLKKTGVFQFIESEIDSDPIQFYGEVRHRGIVQRLEAGQEYQVWVNPFDPNQLFVCEREGRGIGAWLGVAARNKAVRRDDLPALERAFGEAKRAHSEALQPIRQRAAKELRKRTADYQHNTELLNQANPKRATEWTVPAASDFGSLNEVSGEETDEVEITQIDGGLV